jgi:hypothetical protein
MTDKLFDGQGRPTPAAHWASRKRLHTPCAPYRHRQHIHTSSQHLGHTFAARLISSSI